MDEGVKRKTRWQNLFVRIVRFNSGTVVTKAIDWQNLTKISIPHFVGLRFEFIVTKSEWSWI